MDLTEDPCATTAKRARRHHVPELAAELIAPGTSVSTVAREHGVNVSQLFRRIRAASLAAVAHERELDCGDRAALEIVLGGSTLRLADGPHPAQVVALSRRISSSTARTASSLVTPAPFATPPSSPSEAVNSGPSSAATSKGTRARST